MFVFFFLSLSFPSPLLYFIPNSLSPPLFFSPCYFFFSSVLLLLIFFFSFALHLHFSSPIVFPNIPLLLFLSSLVSLPPISPSSLSPLPISTPYSPYLHSHYLLISLSPLSQLPIPSSPPPYSPPISLFPLPLSPPPPPPSPGHHPASSWCAIAFERL